VADVVDRKHAEKLVLCGEAEKFTPIGSISLD
jgi:hypothetical protein